MKRLIARIVLKWYGRDAFCFRHGNYCRHGNVCIPCKFNAEKKEARWTANLSKLRGWL